MKKGLLIGGIAAAAVVAAAGILFWRANSTESNYIKMHLDGKLSIPKSETEKYDLNGDGVISKADYFRAKLSAVFSGEEALYPEIFTAFDAKQLGRSAYHEDTGTAWYSLSASGIAFSFRGKECRITLTADSAYSMENAAARYAVYLNEELVTDALLNQPEDTVTLKNTGSETEPANVRLVKLSESASSSLGISSISVYATKDTHDQYQHDILQPEEKKPHLIEFIGDSITCGYGVDGEYGKDSFCTANENAMKSYAYKTAEKLGTDYSMVSYSGHGIISGYTNSDQPAKGQLVPKFYGQVGHCSAVIEERHKIQDDKWEFKRQPDVVVINLGTNDASYTKHDPAKQKEFAAAYTEFLKTIREKNPEAAIVCTLGIMGQDLCDAIDLAADNYKNETGDLDVRVMRFDVQSEADGLAVDWHPSEKTYEKAADKLSSFIRDWMGW